MIIKRMHKNKSRVNYIHNIGVDENHRKLLYQVLFFCKPTRLKKRFWIIIDITYKIKKICVLYHETTDNYWTPTRSGYRICIVTWLTLVRPQPGTIFFVVCQGNQLLFSVYIDHNYLTYNKKNYASFYNQIPAR